jgi:hypothetical protein
MVHLCHEVWTRHDFARRQQTLAVSLDDRRLGVLEVRAKRLL